MTGVCHHAYECDRYLDECGNCRFLSGGGHKDDISHKCWEKKLQVYNEVPMTYITVSKWLEDCARHSSLLKGRDILTINNPFPIEQFYTTPHGIYTHSCRHTNRTFCFSVRHALTIP